MKVRTAKSIWKSSSLWPDIKEALDTGRPLIVYDLETTGLSSVKDRIIEIAAIKYRVDPKEDGGYDMVETGIYHQYINPERELSEIIVSLTGITDEKLRDMPTEADCIDDIEKFFDGCIVSGYNIVSFDNKFMNELYGRFGRFFQPAGCIDCIKMARNRLRQKEDVENFKLATIGAFFGIDFEAHSAIEDTRTTGKLVQIFISEYAADAAEPESTVLAGTLRPSIKTVSYWPGFKGFSRIYVNTDAGSVYYDIRSNAWGGKDIDVNTLDMAWLEQEVFRIVGAASEDEFSQFKGEIRLGA